MFSAANLLGQYKGPQLDVDHCDQGKIGRRPTSFLRIAIHRLEKLRHTQTKPRSSPACGAEDIVHLVEIDRSVDVAIAC